MDTHYEQVMKVACPLPVDDLYATCVELVRSGRELAIIDALTRHARPAARGSFSDFVASPRGLDMSTYLHRLVLELGQDPAAQRGQIVTQLLMAWQLVRFATAGKRTYVVEPGLQRRLLATRLRGLRCGDVRLPYDCLYIEIDPALGFRVFNEETGWHPMYGMYLTDDGPGLRVFTCGLGHGTDDALSHFHLDFSDAERPVDDVISALDSYVRDKDGDWAREQGLGWADIDDLLASWLQPFQWALNLVFYVTHSEPGEYVELNDEARRLWDRIKKLSGNSKKRRRLLARVRELPSRRRIVVGRGVEANSWWPRSAGEARALLTRSLVAGHWQRYHTREGVVWKFREPFWRGAGDEGPSVHEVR